MKNFNSISQEDFKSGKCVVNCKTEELAKEFLGICENNGYKWCSGVKLLDQNNWDKYENNTCYCNGSNGIEYCNVDYFKGKSISIVQFTGFETKLADKETIKNAVFTLNNYPPTTTTKETIEVIYHRKETIALIKTGGKYYKGVSRCHAEDTYDKELGFKIAYERARVNQNGCKY